MLSRLTTRRTAFAALGALLAVGSAGSAWAQADDCAALIGKQFRKWAKTGAGSQTKCHKSANKLCLGTEGVCNDPDDVAFQILDKTKYDNTKAKGLAKIGEAGGACSMSPTVLAQYPGSQVSNATEFVDDLLANRGDEVLGDENLACDVDKVTCFSVIAKQRAAVADKMFNAAIKCQSDVAAPAALDPNCLKLGFCAVTDAPCNVNADCGINGPCEGGILGAITKAQDGITEACITIPTPDLTGADVGSCDPLPGCVTDAAVAEGREGATRAYPNLNCGDTPTANNRTASIDLNTPTDLGGLTIEVKYPRLAMGLPGNGSIGLGDFTNFTVAFLDPFDLDGTLRISAADFNPIQSGQFADVDFDTCFPLTLGVCSSDLLRACDSTAGLTNSCKTCVAGSNPGANCNVPADCLGGGTCTGSGDGTCLIQNAFCSFSEFTNCGSAPLPGCPLNETCSAQQGLTTCTVVAASDTFGNPVDGVTCSVTLTQP